MQMTDDDNLPKCSQLCPRRWLALKECRFECESEIRDRLESLPRKPIEDVAEKFGGPSLDEVAEATQTGFVTRSDFFEHNANAWRTRAITLLDELDKLTAKIARVRTLMEDPDPYRQDLGPDGTFNVPCVLVSDLKEALDG